MIGSSENRISYNGNGIATEFAYTFKILEKSNLKVLHVAADGTEELLTTDYYVDMEKSVVLYPGYAPGAEIPEQNRPPILPVGERLVLYREVPITQESALDKHWPFNVIENGLDKLTIICQQIWDRLQRSFYVSESTSTNFDPKVPIEAGKTFRVKDDGTGFEVTEDPGKVIDGATALLKQTTEQAEFANEAATNAQNAANAAEAVAPEYAKTKAVLDNIVSYTNTATEQANIAIAQADLATTKATNAANSATTSMQSSLAAQQALRDATLISNSGNADTISTQNAADIIAINTELSSLTDATIDAVGLLKFPDFYDQLKFYKQYFIDGIINDDGSIGSGGLKVLNRFVPIDAENKYCLFARTQGRVKPQKIAFYDTSKNFISTVTNKGFYEIEFPANAAYIKFCITSAQYQSYLIDNDWLVFYSGSDQAYTSLGIELTETIPVGNVNIPMYDNKIADIYEKISVVPSYWLEYMQTKLEELKSKMYSLTGKQDSFVFITDIHVPSNYMHSPSLARYIVANSNISKVVLGGDYTTSNDSALASCLTIDKYTKLFNGTDLFVLRGNHDTNYQGTGKVTDEMFYNVAIKYVEKFVDTKGRLYFCYDNVSQKLRYIFMDTRDDNVFPEYAVTDEQLNWLEEKCSELGSDWSVVVLCHMMFTGKEISTGITELPICANGLRIKNKIDSIYDTIQAQIVGIISGHCHRDYSIVSEKGYPIIATTTDAGGVQASLYDINYPVREQGTTTEQAFDVFTIDLSNRKIYSTRFGAGVDREFSY